MEKKYLTTLNTRPFLFKETKMVAELMDQGIAHDEIKDKITNENLFQLKSNHRKESFHSEIKKRLDQLDDFLFEEFLHNDTQTSKLILLYGIVKKDLLFYEWMREVVWDKWITMDYEISKLDTENFMENKREQSEKVANWTENTRDRLMSAYHQILVDAEFANISNKGIYLHRTFIDSKLQDYLIRQKEKRYVEVLLGEVIE